MKIRKLPLGNCNMVGANIEKIRKAKGLKQKDFIAQIQASGLDINPTSYSKLEGQVRNATDKEIFIIAKLLGVTTDTLFHHSDDDPHSETPRE